MIRDDTASSPVAGHRPPGATPTTFVHWILGGDTNLDNCALLCRRHHVAVHEGGWKLERGPNGFTLAT